MRQRLLPALAGVIALSLAGFAPVPTGKPKKPAFDLAALEGSWTVVRCEVGRLGERTVGNEVVHIDKGKWVAVAVFRDGSSVKTVAYALTLDATRSPAVLDMTFTQKEENGNVTSYGRVGVAELKGDRLTVVYTTGKTRPASIDGPLGAAQERWSLKRKKP